MKHFHRNDEQSSLCHDTVSSFANSKAGVSGSVIEKAFLKKNVYGEDTLIGLS